MSESERAPLLGRGDPPRREGVHCVALGVVVACSFFLRAMQFPMTYVIVFNDISQEHNLTDIKAQHPCAPFDNRTAEQKLVVKEVAELDQYLQLAMFLPALVPTLLLGAMVDRLGRRVGLLLPMLGLFLRIAFTCVVVWGGLGPYFLLLPIALEAVCGGFSTTLLVTFGIVADLTPAGPVRTFRISVLEAVQTIASSAGAYVAAQIIQTVDVPGPLLGSLILTAILIGVVFAFFPETLQSRESFSCQAVNPRACVRIYSLTTVDDRRWKLLLALIAFFLTVAVNFSSGSLQPIYLQAEPLCWDQLHVNIYTSVTIVAHWLVLLVVVKGLLRRLRMTDVDIGSLGCISSFVSAVLMAYATEDGVVYAAAVAGVGYRAVIPMIRSYMSNIVGNEEQGSLYAGLGMVEVLMAAAAGYVTMKIYKATLDFFAGLVYLVFAFLVVLILVVMLVLRCYPRRTRRRGNYEQLPSADRPSIQRYDDPPP